MSKITNSRKIAAEEFPDQKSWINNLLGPINTLLQDLILILNGGATLDDNIKSQSYSIRLVSDGVRTDASFSWKWSKNQQPSMMVIGQLIEEGSTVAAKVGFTWQMNGETVVCNISGLTAAKTYQLKVRGIV